MRSLEYGRRDSRGATPRFVQLTFAPELDRGCGCHIFIATLSAQAGFPLSGKMPASLVGEAGIELSVARRLFRGGHVDRGCGQISQFLVRCAFLIESLLQQLDAVFIAQQLGVSPCTAVTSNFIMLDALRSRD